MWRNCIYIDANIRIHTQYSIITLYTRTNLQPQHKSIVNIRTTFADVCTACGEEGQNQIQCLSPKALTQHHMGYVKRRTTSTGGGRELGGGGGKEWVRSGGGLLSSGWGQLGLANIVRAAICIHSTHMQ